MMKEIKGFDDIKSFHTENVRATFEQLYSDSNTLNLDNFCVNKSSMNEFLDEYDL